MLGRFVERLHRGLEGFLASLLVPGVFDGVAVLGVPDALAHHRADNSADTGRGEVVDPAVACHRQVGDGRDAALQQFGHRDLRRGTGILGIEAEDGEVFVERTLAELVAAILLGEALVGRLREGVTVHIHQTGDRDHPFAVDGRVDRARVARPDMGDLVAFEHEIGVFEVDVSLFGLVPRDDVVEVSDLGRLHEHFSPVYLNAMPRPL